MKKVGIITFHASYNYGSMLQAYALQQTILKLGYACEIINFRSVVQKKQFKPIFMVGTLYGRLVRFIIQSTYVCGILKKQRLFEQFLQHELVLSDKEYATLEDLGNADFNYDYYISGSDQIWNVYCNDFNYAYFLPFVKSGKRIAYAPSMGSGLSIKTCDKIGLIQELLVKYDVIGMRETIGARYIEKITSKQVATVLDPTLLFKPEDYDTLIDKKPLIKGDYVFIYSPNYNEKVNEMAAALGDKYNKQVVISQGLVSKEAMLKWGKKFKIYPAAGPKEFLNLCKYASIVCCDSFHAVVFSILFKKCFFTLNGMKDNRISNLLERLHLQDRSFSLSDTYLDAPLQIDFTETFNLLETERRESLNWLKQSLEK
ncbi:polysaccharide pyruvyl transferase family protein [Phocaeicola dorei]|jgi:hypothetical protein|uniref:Polysaccharide pyruvyl transferase domain-containing protein n=1 Tax=Phocaeicola dorei CL02T12C06 TaxID=997876 RepID=I9QS77_9BACT|nr:polysaccharide pyruvyl transferase family protein [Phocaeicola dorei]EIY26949.1 hypothetical protein HMPREF1063_01919 [Phocaeicola dorei CL02T00C15]EIY32278.1 hypothetical protein HMPREF1064_02821 [Phocaeicola dorei CL02T12C06]